MPRPTRLALATSLYCALLLAFPLHGSANAQAPDSLSPDPGRDAYLDETARRLMQGVRAARDTVRLAVDSYTALTRERIRTDLPTLRRDRLWMHGERVARVRWSREEPNVVHLLASRLRYPGPGPDDMPDFFPGLDTEFFAADPLWDPFAVTVIPRYRSIRLVAAKGYGHGAAGRRRNGRGRCCGLTRNRWASSGSHPAPPRGSIGRCPGGLGRVGSGGRVSG